VKKILIIIAVVFALAAVLWVLRPSPAPLPPAKNLAAPAESPVSRPGPVTAGDPSAKLGIPQPGPGASKTSVALVQSRVAELGEARTQLEVKMKSIDERLADSSQSANAATLREAKQALEISLEKMQLEEEALEQFLRNELEGARSDEP
jgi:hypothetical protein